MHGTATIFGEHARLHSLVSEESMRILVTNDDGINSLGLRALIKGLEGLGDITVVAPDREQSGVGASFTLHQPVRIKKVRSRGVKKYTVNGTPGDAVIIALNHISKDLPFDCVISGINQGTNLGSDVFLSGTVGAAMHGHLHGIPSIAISMPLRKRLKWVTGATVARKLVSEINSHKEHYKNLLLNVTVPNVSLDKLQGVDITNLRPASSQLEITSGNDGRSDYYWISVKRPKKETVQSGTDLSSLQSKRVSITPLSTDITDYSVVDRLESLRKATYALINREN
tara:strand:- start:13046 stop:13897 length:852 start_codon:yes stop_codon:yes gene_type:complete